MLISRTLVTVIRSSSSSKSPGTIRVFRPAFAHRSVIRRSSRDEALAIVMIASCTPYFREIAGIWAELPRTGMPWTFFPSCFRLSSMKPMMTTPRSVLLISSLATRLPAPPAPMRIVLACLWAPALNLRRSRFCSSVRRRQKIRTPSVPMMENMNSMLMTLSGSLREGRVTGSKSRPMDKRTVVGNKAARILSASGRETNRQMVR